MTREEILNLSKMTEAEQYQLLAPLFQTWPEEEICPRCDRDLVFEREESLPDLADRLFRETGPNKIYSIHEVYETLFKCDHVWNDHDYINFYRWWALDSLPIHRIQAALLAKEFQK